MDIWVGKSDWISCSCLLQDDSAALSYWLSFGAQHALAEAGSCSESVFVCNGGESLGCGVRGRWNHFGRLWTKSIAANVCIFSNVLTVS